MYAFVLIVILTTIIGFMSQKILLSLSVSAESVMQRKAHWNAVAGNAIFERLAPEDGAEFNYEVDHDGEGWDQIIVNDDDDSAVGSHGVEIKSTIFR